ncbi:MAG: PaaI family thioesterase, partial [Verrucomicrobiae bacterium]|nr:PaaI family thioesterase [Verrucomicrobiae bacterium]
AGYTGIVHGGVVAAALDEVMFWAASFARRRFHLSVEMQVRWVQKARVGATYRLRGEVGRAQRSLCLARSILQDENGRVCAEAEGKYFALRPHEVPLDAAEFCFDPVTLTPRELFGVVET